MMTLPCVGWQFRELVISDTQEVYHAILYGYFEDAMKEVYEAETLVRFLMETSKNYVNANKQFRK